MKKKMKVAIGTVTAAAGLIVAGTFAWFSTTDRVTNPFGMDTFDVTLVEDFDKPEIPLQPGTDITKNVTVANNGNVDVVVRVKLEEALSLLQMTDPTKDGTDKLKVVYTESKEADADEGQIPVMISKEMLDVYTAKTDDGGQGYEEYTTKAPEGITVYRKATTAKVDGKDANTVYSYLAHVTDTAEGVTAYQLVKVTPLTYTKKGDGSDDKSQPATYKVEYAYNLQKDSDTTNGGMQPTLTTDHGEDGDALLDTYYQVSENDSSNFHDAVILNFAENVQVDGKDLAADTLWYLAGDGYFYYTKLLNGNSFSAPLLNSVSISPKAGNALRGGKYELSPVMEAAQADYEAVKSVWGKENTNFTASSLAEAKTGQGQMVYNIINSEGHTAQYTAN